jgi:hypothetical protein
MAAAESTSGRPLFLAGLLAGGAAGALLMRAIARHEAAAPAAPPRLRAGRLPDLVLSDRDWRDIRPSHLPGCLCSRCDAAATPTKAPHEMKLTGNKLKPEKSAAGGAEAPRATSRPPLQRAPSSREWRDALTPPSAFGFRPYARSATRPFKVYAGLNMSEQARVWRSDVLSGVIEEAARRPVRLPNAAAGAAVTFGTIFDMIREGGHVVYVYGGVIRDVVRRGAHVADDIDVLFTISVRQLAQRCEDRGWVRGEDFHLKRDEATGAWRYDYIAIGSGKEKFSGHTLDSNCAGEFTFNCMLFDVGAGLLVDSSGWGLQDAAQGRLRIPYDGGCVSSKDGKSQWEVWSENCDRLPGMISLRFLNFRSRGYGASPETVEHLVRWLNHQGAAAAAATVRVFFKRKVMKATPADGRGAVAGADARLATFKAALVRDFDAALGPGSGERWWGALAQPVAAAMRAELLAKLHEAE